MRSTLPPGEASAVEAQLASRTSGPEYLRGLVQEYGDIVSLGDRAWLVNEPRAARHVLDATGSQFAHMGDFLGRAVPAAPDGRHHRAALADVHRTVGSWSSAPGLIRVQKLIQDVLPEGESVIDPVSIGRQIALSVATEACLGVQDPAVEHASIKLLDTLLPKFSSPWIVPGWLPSPRRLKLNRSDGALQRQLTAAAADSSAAAGSSVLAVLSRRTAEQLADGKPTWPWIKTLLLASQEPAGAASGWALHYLLEEPGWLQQVRREADASNPLEPGVCAPIRQLPVTTAVVLEAMRARTPTWLVSRRAITDIEISGFRASPGHIVYVSPWLLHQRRDLYDDPLKFDPRRWLDPNSARKSHRGYFSFSRGPHSCPGRLPSMALTVCLVAAIARYYHLRIDDGTEVNVDARRSMLPDGLRIRITPRAVESPSDRAIDAEA